MGGSRVGKELNRIGRQIDPTTSDSLFGDTSGFFGNFNPDSSMFDSFNPSNKSGQVGESQGANELAGMAKKLFAETDPLRQSLIQRSSDFLSTGDVTQNPAYGALKQGAEQQFGRARQNILANTPTGGALDAALAGNEYAKASQLTQGMGGLYNQEMARAMQLGAGTPLTAAFGGLGTAGSIQAQMAAAQAQADAAAKSGKGQGAGTIAAAAILA